METKKRIVEKSHELFMRYGIRSISMDEIASQLGISKKTIYLYFTDKDALVDAVVDIEIKQNEQKCILHKGQCENAVHEIFLAVDMVHEMLKVMNPAILFDLQKYHPQGYKKFSDHKNQFFYEIITNNLQRGVQEALYRPEIDIDIMARFRIACMFLIFDPSAFPPNKTNLQNVLKETTESFLYGLASAKGVKLINKYKQQRLNK